MTRNPSLDDLRRRVFKHSAGGVEGGSWLARRIGRPSAVYGTWLAVRLPVSAHAVTVASLVAGFAGAAAIGTGSRAGFLVGVAGLHLAYWLDHVDGQVARWRESASLEGVYLDYLMHHAQGMALGFSLGFGIARQTGELGWTVVGFLIAMGWTSLNLHNDCRYKAFFQRLKRGGGHLRVNSCHPVSGMAIPSEGNVLRKGCRLATWLCQKACEPPLVLVGLTGMAVMAILMPQIWRDGWRIGAAGMAFVAPLLAVARVSRAISGRTLAAEFAGWFSPVDGPEKALAARTGGAARVE